MCGRYVQTQTFAELARRFDLAGDQLDLRPRYNIAPTQEVPAIVLDAAGRRVLRMFRWGLVPRWADSPAMGQHLINARAETVADKPAFREAFRRRRCLIPATGFYEWHKDRGRKIPMYIQFIEYKVQSSGVQSSWGATSGGGGFAGIWESWTRPDGRTLETCAIITTPANERIARIHDRMPAILRPPPAEDEATWLDPSITDPAALMPLLTPYPSQLMRVHPVSSRVNTPGVDDASLMEEVAPPPQTQGELF